MHASTKIRFTRKEAMRFDGSHGPSVRKSSASKTEISAGATTKRTMTLAEVAKHDKPTDCYIAVHGKVYNVTSFLSKHPGGEERIMMYAGNDATFAFDNQNHSPKARKWLQDFLVCELA